MNEIILKQAQKFEKEYKEILENIKKFDKIAVFRHIMPDFDALGTQFGLATWLKDNFKDKDIKILGDNHVTFTPKGLYPETDKVNDSWFNDDFLAIIVDVGDEKRIADPRFKRAKFTIKLDHHPETDKIFNISVVDTSLCAASELVTNMLLSFGEEYTLSKEAASYFYSAIVGDSGRFLFGSTSRHTFEISSELLARNIQIVPLYEKMYEKGIDDLKFMQFVLNNFKITPEGTAYYVLTQKDLDELHLSSEQGKEHVNLFSSIKGVNIWCSITEDVTEPCFRISLRSRYYNVNEIATNFKGGGHKQASGAQIASLKELDKFIEACDNKIKEGQKL